MSPFDRAWSPYAAGILIGLLQIPAFLIIETALGASSSYVTVGAALTGLIDPSLLKIEYAAKHVAANAKNLRQIALAAGVALGAFASMKMSGATRASISPIWTKALGSSSSRLRYAVAFCRRFLNAARRADRRRLHQRSRTIRDGAIVRRLDHRRCRNVCGRHRHRLALAPSNLALRG